MLIGFLLSKVNSQTGLLADMLPAENQGKLNRQDYLANRFPAEKGNLIDRITLLTGFLLSKANSQTGLPC